MIFINHRNPNEWWKWNKEKMIAINYNGGFHDIDENSLDETQYSDAYHKLFFQFPEVEGDSAYNAIVKSAFEQKKIDYQQDIIIETYMAGVNNEEFLKLVEKTLLRLEKCSSGIKEGNSDTSNCVFFGMEMAYSEPEHHA